MRNGTYLVQSFNATTDPVAAPASGLLSNLLFGSGGVSSLTDSLPSKQDVAVSYLEAIVAFWVIGGITLYLIKKAK